MSVEGESNWDWRWTALALLAVACWLAADVYDRSLGVVVAGCVLVLLGMVAVIRRRFALRGMRSRRPPVVHTGIRAVMLGLLWIGVGIGLIAFEVLKR